MGKGIFMSETETQPGGMEAVAGFIKPEADKPAVIESLEGQPHGGALKRRTAIPFQKLGEFTHLIMPFKLFYIEKKKADLEIMPSEILAAFQSQLPEGEYFLPYPNQYTIWRRKWDRTIVNELTSDGRALALPPSMAKELVMTDPLGNVIKPTEEQLEEGAQTLSGALLNDANRMLAEDQEFEDIYTPQELIKRRSYVLNVVTHIQKTIQGNRLVMIKSNAEKRETASFLVDLMRRATAGKLDPSELTNLKNSIPVEATKDA